MEATIFPDLIICGNGGILHINHLPSGDLTITM